MRKKKTLFFAGLVAFVCCFFGSVDTFTKSVSADAVASYYLDVGRLNQFDSTSGLWKGAPNDNDCYVKTNNKLNPGTKYATALCFTAPCDGTISPSGSGSFGTIYQDIATANISKSDGVRFSVFKNNTKIYPTTEDAWAIVPQTSTNKLTISYSNVEMSEGDKLYYIVDNGGNGKSSWDTTYLVMGFNWTSEGETSAIWFDSDKSRWTDEASGAVVYDQKLNYPKKDLLSYHYVSILNSNVQEDVDTEDKKVYVNSNDFSFVNLNGTTPAWSIPNRTDCYITADLLVPNGNFAAAVCFTAPCDGMISNGLGCGEIYRSGKVQDNTDDTRLSIVLNDTVVYPYTGIWDAIPTNADEALKIIFNQTEVKAGDKLWYIVDNGGAGNATWDLNKYKAGFLWTDDKNPDGIYVDFAKGYWTDEASGEALVDFGNYQKKDVFSYHYVSVQERNQETENETENKKVVVKANDFTFTKLNDTPIWGGVPGRNAYCYATENLLVPNEYYAAAVCFTAPCDGRISNSLGGGKIWRSGELKEGTDSTRLSVVLNDTVVYPHTGVWAELPCGEENALQIAFNSMDVKAGDKLWYIVDCGGNYNSGWDSNKFVGGFLWVDEQNPDGIYVDFAKGYWTDEVSGETNVDFGAYQKKDVFSYHYVVLDECNAVGAAEEIAVRDLTTELPIEKINYSQSKGCYIKIDDLKLIAYSDYCQPGDYDALGIVWTAPKTGRIDISDSWICNFNYHPELNVNGIRSDGVRIRIVLNGNKQIFPVEDEWYTITDANRHAIEVKPFAINEGDELTFVLDNNGECNWDNCNYNIVIAFAETDSDYTNTYRNITDYRKETDEASTWSYCAVLDAAEEEERTIAPLPVVSYSTGGTGCSGSVENISIVVVLLGTIATMLLWKRNNKKAKGEGK